MNFTRQQKLVVFLLGFMGFWVMGDNYAAAPLIVDIAQDFSIDIGTAALPVAAYMLPFGLVTLLFGPLADKYGKAKIISIAAFGTAIFSGLGAVAFDIFSLGIIRAINGGFAAGILPVSISLVGETFEKPKEIHNAIGMIMGMFFLGAAVATIIGGGLSQFGSWRLVYLTYGIVEFPIAIAMLFMLERDSGTTDILNFKKAYVETLTQPGLLKTISILSLVGFAVFGSFTYAGKYIQTQTGHGLLVVGSLMSLFGISAFLGGRYAGTLKQKIGNKLPLIAGLLGAFSWTIIVLKPTMLVLSIGLIGYGLAFVFLQSTLVSSAQQLMPTRRGTTMAAASFNMFIGGAIGVQVNRMILGSLGFEAIFMTAATLILISGILSKIVLSEKVKNKKKK